MEVGPTCHYVMGGIEVDPDTGAAARIPGLFAAGEAAGGMHGSNRLGGTSLSDLLVFGRRAGLGAALYAKAVNDGGHRPAVTEAAVEWAEGRALAPFSNTGGENAFTIQKDLQQIMNDLVGIIRTESELVDALAKLDELRARVANVSVVGGRAYNPGWHLALDLDNMIIVSECIARAALLRQESRGGHTREDYPGMNSTWRTKNLICQLDEGRVDVFEQPLPSMPDDLITLFDINELKKYLTADELSHLPEGAQA
jgi:succinate dehydrogenase / fumarate reductase flavoprotein subunit